MTPSARLCPQCHHLLPKPHRIPLLQPQHARTASAITPATSLAQTTDSPPPTMRYPPTQPPSHRPPEYRKSQLHRQYTSLLRSTPLILIFQHNNLKSSEWVAIRRELTSALRKTDEQQALSSPLNFTPPLSESIKLQIITTSIFASALLVADYFKPATTNTTSPLSPPSQLDKTEQNEETYTHGLSRTAYTTTHPRKYTHPLRPLLHGPLALLTFPTISPTHLSTALRILAPQAPTFPAPSRRANPGYHDLTTQAGLQKLMLLGARVEGEVFDGEGVRWVGGLEGGMEGLRGRLVGLLGGVGVGLTGALEGVGRGLWGVVEGRRGMLEQEEKERERKEGGGDGT
ncbi:MAG: hypothetical protein HETSPECPRED_009801 [Heterodermia speciosa]|uniref:Uncharacterized protein n=1 Tax=Heterodermia speciosa TaxID=116794 RepID=A0A8H3G2K4_9LECA|nr:MAG: hypothetical protein HETSPECPRED_009801 [Heterodermia speciosa]